MNEINDDRALRIKTIGDQLNFPQLAHYHRYEPTPYLALEQVFSEYVIEPDEGFVDMGCGKGRVAFWVHDRFGVNVTGVDMNPVFYEECLQNKQSYLKKSRQKRGSVQFECMLAQEYKIKPDECVFYFFNPFSIHIFQKVLDNILRSVADYPRTVTIVLYYPSDDYLDRLHDHDLFEWLAEVPVKGLIEQDDLEWFVLFQYNGKGD